MKSIQKIKKELTAKVIAKKTLVKLKGGGTDYVVNPDTFDID